MVTFLNSAQNGWKRRERGAELTFPLLPGARSSMRIIGTPRGDANSGVGRFKAGLDALPLNRAIQAKPSGMTARAPARDLAEAFTQRSSVLESNQRSGVFNPLFYRLNYRRIKF